MEVSVLPLTTAVIGFLLGLGGLRELLVDGIWYGQLQPLLIGAAGALRTAAGGIRQPDEDAWVQRIVADLRDALGDQGFAAAEAEGSELDLADAVSRALALSAR